MIKSDSDDGIEITRTDVVRNVVYDLTWLDDYNHIGWIRSRLLDSQIVENWHGGKKEIDLFIEASRVENDGHYSEYNSENESENEYTEQEAGKTQKHKTPFGKRKAEYCRIANSTDV